MKLSKSSSLRKHRRGLSLVEVMLAVIIMSTMLVAAFSAVGASAKGRVAQQESAFGLSLGRQLLAEVMQTRYQDLINPGFGGERGENSRSQTEAVADYAGYK